MKYGIDWNKENAVDGGFLDDRSVAPFLVDERNYSEEELKYMGNVNAGVYQCYARMDKNSESLYMVLCIMGLRRGSSSTVSIIFESDMLNEKIERTIEISRGIKSALCQVRVIIPIKNAYDESLCPDDVKYTHKAYDINLKYKDSKQEEYKSYGKNGRAYAILQSIYDYEDIILNNEDITIQYGYMDVVHGDTFIPIEGIEAYQKDDGIWTSDVVANPEKYLKSDLEWYYSDERMVDYIEARGLLPQDKIDAIRAANYEDIFSPEYQFKKYGKMALIAFALVVIFVFVIIIRKKFLKRKY